MQEWPAPRRALLPDGRLHLQDGPIDLVIGIEGVRTAMIQAREAAWLSLHGVLEARGKVLVKLNVGDADLDALVEQGLAGMLDSDVARDFFAKLAGGTPDEPAPRLSEAETAFWTKAQLEPALADEEAAAFFEEICIFLHEARENDRRQAIMEAIRRAQQQGASDEALRLLGELQALSGRGDE